MQVPPVRLSLLLRTLLILAPLVLAARAAAQTISVSGNPSALRITTAIAGSPPTAVSNNATTYSVTNLLVLPKKITAQLNSDMPAGVTLKITLAAPAGATSLGPVTLTTTAQDVVQNIGVGTFSNLTITYQLSATTAAGVVAAASKTVTLTLQ
jgi:hypothetical protein